MRLVSKNTSALSKAGAYRCAQSRVGCCFICQLSANCKSGGRHKFVFPTWYIDAASAIRLYILADSNSSATQGDSLVQMCIKLSWANSNTVSPCSATLEPGMINERSGNRNVSTTFITSSSPASANCATVLTLIILLTSNPSCVRSVSDL